MLRPSVTTVCSFVCVLVMKQKTVFLLLKVQRYITYNAHDKSATFNRTNRQYAHLRHVCWYSGKWDSDSFVTTCVNRCFIGHLLGNSLVRVVNDPIKLLDVTNLKLRNETAFGCSLSYIIKLFTLQRPSDQNICASKNEIWIVGQDDILQYIDRKDQPHPYFGCISLQWLDRALLIC